MSKHTELQVNPTAVSNTQANSLSERERNTENTRKLTLAAMLTAVVVVLQLLGSAIHFGIFSINLT